MQTFFLHFWAFGDPPQNANFGHWRPQINLGGASGAKKKVFLPPPHKLPISVIGDTKLRLGVFGARQNWESFGALQKCKLWSLETQMTFWSTWSQRKPFLQFWVPKISKLLLAFGANWQSSASHTVSYKQTWKGKKKKKCKPWISMCLHASFHIRWGI